MRILFFDCQAGIAGDMWTAALLDLGVPIEPLQEAVASLGLGAVALRTEAVRRAGIAATRLVVEVPSETPEPHRGLGEVQRLLRGAAVPPSVRERACAVFERLAEAEARAHGWTIEQVHFHEVGAVDSLVDVLCGCLAVELLGVDEVHASVVELGSGTVKCAHGVLPVPAPGTLFCLQGVPTSRGGAPGERTTPTGAALLREHAVGFESRLRMVPEAVGHGAGTRDDPGFPNILRATLAETVDSPAGAVVELACNLDTATGEELGWLVEAALRQGALDAWVVAATMKKGRPGHVFHALCEPSARGALTDFLLAESGSLGVRSCSHDRVTLRRWVETRETALGPVRFKCVAVPGTGRVRVRPEDEDLRRLAAAHGLGRRALLERIGEGEPPGA